MGFLKIFLIEFKDIFNWVEKEVGTSFYILQVPYQENDLQIFTPISRVVFSFSGVCCVKDKRFKFWWNLTYFSI